MGLVLGKCSRTKAWVPDGNIDSPANGFKVAYGTSSGVVGMLRMHEDLSQRIFEHGGTGARHREEQRY